MTDKAFPDDVNLSFESFDEQGPNKDEHRSLYEYPKIDFSSGWKDRQFVVIFWTLVSAVIMASLVLCMSIMYVFTNLVESNERLIEHYKHSIDVYTKVIIYTFVGAAVAGSVTSFVTFFLLQLCAGRNIMCTFTISIVIEILLGVVLLVTVHWSACIPPFCLLLITLIFMYCVRNQIPLAEVHLRIGCAVIRSYPASLILVVSGIFIVELLWLVSCLLMAAAVLFTLLPSDQCDTRKNSPTHRQSSHSRIVYSIIGFVVLLLWYWGAATFANTVRFISSCNVGQWWFSGSIKQQYILGTSIKRAFTTNFGTICLGSLLGTVLEAVRSSTGEENRINSLSSIIVCFIRILKKIIGCMNEWVFIYAALTGKSFAQGSRSSVDLLKKSGWTMIVNDILIKYYLLIINLMIVVTSAVIGGLIAYIFVKNLSTDEMIITIIVAALISSLIGSLFSAIMTIILNSCARTVFVCFTLNPAVLGATHPEHLKHLTKVWQKFYLTEFVTDGCADHFLTLNTATNV